MNNAVDSTPHSTALLLLIPLLVFAAYWVGMRSTDPYGLFHLSLNRLPSDDPDSLPKTEWLNMGYWKDTEKFPDAAKALAMKLIAAANLKQGGSILDVGHGTGESLILLLSEPTLPKPSHLVGITSLQLHHLRSLQRVQKRQAEQPALQATKVDLHYGDAVYDGVQNDHPLSLESKVSFDSILALDCAHHFNTRQSFLEQSFRKLASGGRIALADICFSSDALKTPRVKLITSMVRVMPAANRISDGDYVASMKNIGYDDVKLEDITADVYPQFIVFLKSRGIIWWFFGCVLQWYTGVGAKFVIVSGRKPI
ncbi:S-adenosyl-L-methionine-dependent methyltransferase [Pholiota conissans]|uniref:S-adenosyl-L-methionine-dependent methyltransferase n=1 Tax=Pholiota conissans TaxID=109636 RepID=A0A9P6D375_9AGAR|nr:S-adenosyl-L-methionine-dependent methyltransferase [Pholiota conissans]